MMSAFFPVSPSGRNPGDKGNESWRSKHTYCVGTSQMPDATRVAGFHTWKSLGRYVKKGEHGLVITAPMIHKKRAKSEGKVVSIDAESETYVTFRPVYVFDQSQTEGDPLPDLHSTRVEGDATVYLERLKKHVTDSGITLEFGTLASGADGLSYGGKIMLKEGMTGAETFSVLVHELAHLCCVGSYVV